MACYYNTQELSDKIYFLTKAEVNKLDISIDSQRQAYAEADLLISRHLKVNSLEYEEESLYDNQNRYEFSKSLTFSISGFLPPDRFFNQYSVVIERKNVGKFLVNYDHQFEIESTFNGYTTSVTLTALSNFMLLPMKIGEENTERSIYSVDCGYFVSDWKGAKRLTITETGLGRFPRIITDFQVDNLEIHYINGQIETNLSVILPIKELNTTQYWNEIQYYPTNLKDITLTNNKYQIKWSAMLPTYDINGAESTLTLRQLDNNFPEINVI